MATPVPETPAAQSDDHIEVCGLTKTYPGAVPNRPALSGVDLQVPRRRFVSLIGPSGCGKSTLLRVLAGLTAPDQGRVRLFGATPRRMCRAKAVGLVPQTPALLPWLTVRRNVALPGLVNRRAGRGVEPADELLRNVGLAEAARLYPYELSGGMRQRVAIARAFALRPELLLMDEPFSALDEFTREALQMRLLDLWQQRSTTVVFVTHSVQEAVALSDEVVVMAPGRIHEVVPVDLPRPRDQAAVAGSQARETADRVRAGLKQAWEHGTVADALATR